MECWNWIIWNIWFWSESASKLLLNFQILSGTERGWRQNNNYQQNFSISYFKTKFQIPPTEILFHFQRREREKIYWVCRSTWSSPTPSWWTGPWPSTWSSTSCSSRLFTTRCRPATTSSTRYSTRPLSSSTWRTSSPSPPTSWSWGRPTSPGCISTPTPTTSPPQVSSHCSSGNSSSGLQSCLS